ncbi:MAG TPA: YhjD/YihY/BrkB family envelope integrity protein [Acidimicrobiia bacterium]
MRLPPWTEPIQQTITRFGRHRASSMAAAIAYRALFAVGPVLLVSVAVAGLFFSSQEVVEAVVSTVTEALGPDAGEVVSQILNTTTTGIGTIGLLGLLLLIWAGSLLFVEASRSLDVVFFDAPVPEGLRASIRQRLLSLAAVLAGGAILLIGLIGTTVTSMLSRFDVLSPLLEWLTPLATLLIVMAVVLLSYRYLPGHHVAWRPALVGAVATGLAMAVATWGLSIYFSLSTRASAAFVAGGVFVVVLAAYVFAMIYLGGAELARTLADGSGGHVTSGR